MGGISAAPAPMLCSCCAKKDLFPSRSKTKLYLVGNAGRKVFGFRLMRGIDLWGNPMKNAINNHLPDEDLLSSE